ncbi:hypothetical protein HD806DRAFT_523905 [Xylariaceae sp. AK1471]|nr:hypothetical protein HD806DRAFT_523905 [Xylariaceae sp. AK1471]
MVASSFHHPERKIHSHDVDEGSTPNLSKRPRHEPDNINNSSQRISRMNRENYTNNDYTTRSMKNCHHNIVIASLPTDGYGTINAATVAGNMRRTFSSLQVFLVVGIAGGAPGKVDVRLGDIVVSEQLVQYDLGKAVRNGHFESTAFPLRPIQELRTAVSALRTQHELRPSMIPAILRQMVERNQYMEKYTYQESLRNMLFDSAYEHPESEETCDRCDQSRLVKRTSRHDQEPKIHYGVIASGDQVIKHAKTRDKLAQRFNALCFEMEGAGLIESFQCLVIRSVCDYADSHKNKQWQEYAAATAAAYAKEPLSVMPVIEVQTPNIEWLVESRRNLMKSLWFQRIDSRYSSIERAHKKTCEWILCHPDYLGWLDPAEYHQNHGFLWIRGKPGAGKSTLMKFINTRALNNDATTISFFFNARGDNLEKSTEGMYRSLLLQLLMSLPNLKEVLDNPRLVHQNQREHITWGIDVLQDLFSEAITRLGSRQLVCIVDALDECGRSQVRSMVAYFECLGQLALENGTKLRICFSSRHYPSISIRNGRKLTLEDQIGHRHDLMEYVRSKLDIGLEQVASKVKVELLEKAAGVFLWVVLVVKILNEEYEDGRLFAVRNRLKEVPAGLSELFKDILRRDNKNTTELLLCIRWITCGRRPMKLAEFYYVMAAGWKAERDEVSERGPEQVRTEDMIRFVSSCSKGLAEVTKSGHLTVQFIHESVRDFLIRDGGIYELWPELRRQDFLALSHEQLKQFCHAYMRERISNGEVFNDGRLKGSEMINLRESPLKKYPFLEYAVESVLFHADRAAIGLPQHDFLQSFDLKTWISLYNFLSFSGRDIYTLSTIFFYILADQNWARLIHTIAHYDPQVHVYVDGQSHGYPFFAALQSGHKEAVRALLQAGNSRYYVGDVDIIVAQFSHKYLSHYGRQTPLKWAVTIGHLELVRVIQLLLDRGADINSKDRSGKTPLFHAVEYGHQELLLDKGAYMDSMSCQGTQGLSGI